MIYELVENGEAGDEFLLFAFFHTDPEVQSEIYPLYTQFEKERRARGFRLKGIVPERVREHFKARVQTSLRYTDFPVLENINIFRDKVSLTPWGERKVSFLIRSPQLAQQFSNYFNLTWDSLRRS